jgi:sec-independent protein translocase protein TatA
MGGLGMWELLLILLIVIVLFGASRIPQLAKGLGEGIRNFKQGIRGDEDRPEIEDGGYRDDDRRFRDDVERREESRRSI